MSSNLVAAGTSHTFTTDSSYPGYLRRIRIHIPSFSRDIRRGLAAHMAKHWYGISVRKICKHGIGIDLVVASPVIDSFIFLIQIACLIAMHYDDIEGGGKK